MMSAELKCLLLLYFADFYQNYDFSPIEHLRIHEHLFFETLAEDLEQSPSLFLKMIADDEATCRYGDDGRY